MDRLYDGSAGGDQEDCGQGCRSLNEAGEPACSGQSCSQRRCERTSVSVAHQPQVTEAQKVRRRVKAVRAIRRSTELEGSRSTDAARADQIAYVRGSITVSELGERVRRRYNPLTRDARCGKQESRPVARG